MEAKLSEQFEWFYADSIRISCSSMCQIVVVVFGFIAHAEFSFATAPCAIIHRKGYQLVPGALGGTRVSLKFGASPSAQLFEGSLNVLLCLYMSDTVENNTYIKWIWCYSPGVSLES